MGNERKRDQERKQKRIDGTPKKGSGKFRRGDGPGSGPQVSGKDQTYIHARYKRR